MALSEAKRASMKENTSTGLCGVWKDKYSDGVPTYKLLSDGTAQFIKEDGGTSSTSGFGTWELSPNGQVKVACQVKTGCTEEKDAQAGNEEHLLCMHCMMFEGVFKRQKDLTARDEERVIMLSEGKEVPPLHPLTIIIDNEGTERLYELFRDETLSDLKDRLKLDINDKVMLGNTELAQGKSLFELVPAKSQLRVVVPERFAEGEKPEEGTPAAAQNGNGKKEQITESFSKWDVNGDKIISQDELSRILVVLGISEGDIPTIFKTCGAMKGSGVDYSQFINWVYSSGDQN